MLNMEFKMIIYYFFVLLFISGILCKEDKENCDQHTKDSIRLKCDLTDEYDPAERPVKSYRDVINVHLEILPVEIELNDQSDQFALTTWMVMNWTDIFLIWNPNSYGGINEIIMDCSEIWTPDLVSLSTLAEDPYQSASNRICKLNSTGSASVVFTNTYRAYCSSDRTYWPYDEQSCSIYLGSRVFIGPSLNFTLKEIMPDYLKQDKTWILKDLAPSVVVYKTGAVDNETYSRLEFKFILKRHSSAYSATFVYPGAGTAVTILAVLWLDIMSPERIYMLALIIFNCLIFLECFTFILPASGTKPPLLVSFFRDCMVMSGISIVITIINRRLMNSLLKPMWLTAMVRWLNEKSNITNYFLINVEPETSEVKENEDESPSTFSIASQKQKEWKIFATCIDRLMFLMYFFIFLVVLIKLYPAI